MMVGKASYEVSNTGNPKMIGLCPTCGNKLYEWLTHGCVTALPIQPEIPLIPVNTRRWVADAKE